MKAYHATERSKISLCWNFVATAARMCQCLGYHRTIGRKDDGEEYTSAEIASRKYIFWFIYLMDKTMSLCLGRTSTLQDYDIAIDYPELTTDPELRPWRVVLHVWFDYSKIMGRVYEHLFSARALTDTAAVRSQKAHEIGEEIKIWRDGCLHFEFTGGHHSFFFEWMGHSIDLSYYLMLTLIYRVLPPTQPPETPSGLSLLCVESARRALQLHQHIITVFQANDTFMLKGYVDW